MRKGDKAYVKRVMSRMECGQPGHFPVDVVSKSFPHATVRGCFRQCKHTARPRQERE